jgi:hypothetical protein
MTGPLAPLYQELWIWKKKDEQTAVRYVCLMNIATRKYSVQTVDFYHLPVTDAQRAHFRAQFVELFCEADPGERSGGFDSLEDAIAAHHAQFD